VITNFECVWPNELCDLNVLSLCPCACFLYDVCAPRPVGFPSVRRTSLWFVFFRFCFLCLFCFFVLVFQFEFGLRLYVSCARASFWIHVLSLCHCVSCMMCAFPVPPASAGSCDLFSFGFVFLVWFGLRL